VRRRVAIGALGLGAIAVTAIVVAAASGGGEGGKPRATAGGGSTATVERRTLVQRETVDGTLGYAGERTVINRLGTSSGGGGGDSDSPTVPAAYFTPDDDSAEQPDDDSAEQPPEEDQPEENEPDDDSAERPSRPEQEEPEQEEPEQEQPEQEQPEDDGRSSQGNSPQGSSPQGSAPDSSGDDDSEPSYDGSGTVTSLPRAGSVVSRGQALYRLDGDPIVLMYGSTPAYRALRSGVSDGADVRELEQNLAALGFDPGTVDDTFSSTTAAAISDWQESLGLDQTGAVELGRVVFLPGPRRIGEHKTTVGSVLGSGSEVLDTSSTKRVVSVELEAGLQELAHEGERVEVELPGGGFARGHITKVGRVAREVEGDSADPGAEPQLVIDVTIELRRKRGLGNLDETPVSVGLAQETRRDALAVPVTALVARQGGGYGLELAGNRRILPVEAGLFADGYVEVSGGAIREGTRVVVPGE
jgi:peptidoglycan hydrolase-like protein with peptidoglycan-binding domain